ncbi:fimbrial protein [Morganella morganii]|uniref:fimbrial protein n=1 Tax=Morganella morganii TaxID=582 RepID=UPI0032DB3049
MLRKTHFFAGLLMLLTGYAQAECYNDGNKQAPPLTADLSETFYRQTETTLYFNTRYSGEFSCNGYSSSVSNASYLQKRSIVVGFQNGRYPVEFRVIDLQPGSTQKFAYSRNPYPADRLQARFTLSARVMPQNSRSDVTVPGSQYRFDGAVIAADTTRVGILQFFVRLGLDILTYLLTGHWPEHNEDLFLQPLDVIYQPRETTCTFDNADLLVELPQVDRAQLLRNTTAGMTRFHLDISCRDRLNGRTSRPVKAYLASNQVWLRDMKTLIDTSQGAAQGVGIRVGRYADTNDNSALVINPPGRQPRADSYLFEWGKDKFIEVNNGFNLWAYYYVYDAARLSAGRINTTAILNFEYY